MIDNKTRLTIIYSMIIAEVLLVVIFGMIGLGFAFLGLGFCIALGLLLIPNQPTILRNMAGFILGFWCFGIGLLIFAAISPGYSGQDQMIPEGMMLMGIVFWEIIIYIILFIIWFILYNKSKEKRHVREKRILKERINKVKSKKTSNR